MSVTPWHRLSEAVIANGIMKFYRDNNLVPVGVAEVGLLKWADKMAYGVRKLVQRFRKIYTESPDGANLPNIKNLKARCREAKIPTTSGLASLGSSSSTASLDSEDLNHFEQDGLVPVAGQGESKNIWEKLAAKVAQKKAEKTQQGQGRPVATPARNEYELPSYVVDTLKTLKAPEPFVVNPKACAEAVPEEEGKRAEKPADDAPQVPQSGVSVDAEGGPHETKVPQSAPTKAPVQVAERKEGCPSSHNDAPKKEAFKGGTIMQLQKAFVAQKRKEGMNYKDAVHAWMLSDVRADELAKMPFEELKRRRFV